MFGDAWLPRWAEKAARPATASCRCASLPTSAGLTRDELITAIERGDVKAMLIDGADRRADVNARSRSWTPRSANSNSWSSSIRTIRRWLGWRDIVLPKAMSLEKDGTFTSFDRTVQRVRAAVPAMGEAKPVNEAIGDAQRSGWDTADHLSRARR